MACLGLMAAGRAVSDNRGSGYFGLWHWASVNGSSVAAFTGPKIGPNIAL